MNITKKMKDEAYFLACYQSAMWNKGEERITPEKFYKKAEKNEAFKESYPTLDSWYDELTRFGFIPDLSPLRLASMKS